MILIDEATVVVDEATLLPPVTLHVDQGTWHAVRGANGAGKSTLLALIAAVRTPTGGTITIDGRAPDARKKWFRKQVSALAVTGAEKLLKREIDANAHKALLDELAAEI